MNFDASSVWIIASVAGLAMGIIWVATGLAYSIWRDTDLFDIGFFNLGLVFTFAGTAQLAINRARLKRG